MAIKRDLSDLPPPTEPSRLMPSAPEIMPLVIDEWVKRDTPDRVREMAFADARIRHSWAGHCARRLAYEVTGTEASNDPAPASYWSFAVGRSVHEIWQGLVEPALKIAGWTDIEVERKARVEFNGPISAAHLDLSGTDPDGLVTAFELKSINGYGFKVLQGAVDKRPGPRAGDLLQGAVNAEAIDADRLLLLYVSLESISRKIAQRAGLDEYGRFSAEFSLSPEQFLPLAEGERGRWQEVVAAADAGLSVDRTIPDPEIPAGAVITDPTTGRWEITSDGYVTGSGNWWGCDYCPFQLRCTEDLHAGQ